MKENCCMSSCFLSFFAHLFNLGEDIFWPVLLSAQWGQDSKRLQEDGKESAGQHTGTTRLFLLRHRIPVLKTQGLSVKTIGFKEGGLNDRAV